MDHCNTGEEIFHAQVRASLCLSMSAMLSIWNKGPQDIQTYAIILIMLCVCQHVESCTNLCFLIIMVCLNQANALTCQSWRKRAVMLYVAGKRSTGQTAFVVESSQHETHVPKCHAVSCGLLMAHLHFVPDKL